MTGPGAGTRNRRPSPRTASGVRVPRTDAVIGRPVAYVRSVGSGSAASRGRREDIHGAHRARTGWLARNRPATGARNGMLMLPSKLVNCCRARRSIWWRGCEVAPLLPLGKDHRNCSISPRVRSGVQDPPTARPRRHDSRVVDPFVRSGSAANGRSSGADLKGSERKT